MEFDLTREQKQVLADVFDWYKRPDRGYLSLGGYAGTGKTTLLAILRQLLNKLQPKLKVAFCAYTGKASQVLEITLKDHGVRLKNDRVSTIHSLIYEPIIDKSGRISGWKTKDAIKADLVIIDESSMVDENIWQDLLAYELPILAVGDHGQLPPVNGKFNLMEDPDLVLETIHRQAKDNPIIQLSMMARERGYIPVGNYGAGVVKLDRYDGTSGMEVEELLRGYSKNTLILCGFNHSRVRLNRQIRIYMDMGGDKPRAGDKVICLKNNWEKGIYNGMIGKLVRLIPAFDPAGKLAWYEVEVELDDGREIYNGKISAHQFNQLATLHEFDSLKGKALGDLFDFGYALTVHKAQGSQANRVLLFEERSQHMSDEEWSRWLYTGVTRAEEYLTIVGVDKHTG